MLINHFSVSRSQCFDECQLKYKYRYHLKVISEKPEELHFVYGKLVHKAAEVFVQTKGERPIFEIGADLLNNKIEFDGVESIHRLGVDYRNKFWEHLRNVEKLTRKIGFDGEIEHKIEYDLDPPNNKVFLGFIDRLIIKNETALIIDYKTSKNNSWRKTKKTIKEDLQMNAYACYVYDKFEIKPENIHAALYYLEGGNLVSTNFKIENIKKTKELMRKKFTTIEKMSENMAVANVGNHCVRCDYSSICPYFNGIGAF